MPATNTKDYKKPRQLKTELATTSSKAANNNEQRKDHTSTQQNNPAKQAKKQPTTYTTPLRPVHTLANINGEVISFMEVKHCEEQNLESAQDSLYRG